MFPISSSAIQGTHNILLSFNVIDPLYLQEPQHFMMLFKGKMIVGLGSHPKSREGLAGLYHVRQPSETFEWNTRAVQVPTVFLIITCGNLLTFISL
jgi:hypothetical protein